jgi:predicted transcriptional regulator
MSKIASGAKRDLLVVNFVIGLIETSIKNDEAFKNDKDLTKRTNKYYKINRKIDKKLSDLSDFLIDINKKVFNKYNTDGELGKWVKNKLNSKMIKIIVSLNSNTNFELLANQVLFEAFKERNKPLIEEFECLRDFDTYSLYDMLVSTNLSDIEEDTYEEARKIVGDLR